MKVPRELKGFRTMFTSFHHFPPEEARAILQNAVDAGEGIGIFEITRRAPSNDRPYVCLGSHAVRLHSVDPSVSLVTVALDVSGSDHSLGLAVRWSGVLPCGPIDQQELREHGRTTESKRIPVGDRRAFNWEGADYLPDWLSVGVGPSIHSVTMESSIVSPTAANSCPTLIRRQHIVVVVHERAFGRIFQSLQRDFLIHRSVSEQARAAQVYGAAVGQLQVDGHDHAELIVHAGLRDLEAEHDIAVCVLVEGGVDLVGGQRGAVDVFVEEPVQAMIAVEVHLRRSCVFPSWP